MNQAISSNKQVDLINLGRTSFVYLLWEFNPLVKLMKIECPKIICTGENN